MGGVGILVPMKTIHIAHNILDTSVACCCVVDGPSVVFIKSPINGKFNKSSPNCVIGHVIMSSMDGISGIIYIYVIKKIR
jgi:hypothetical protein